MISRLLGFVREALLIMYFGRSGLTDIYKLSFTIPDFLYFLIAGGALSSAFIPVFTRYMTEGKEEDAWKVFSTVACTFLSFAALLIVAGWVFAEPLCRKVAWGLAGRPEAIKQLAYLTRIVLPGQVFFFLGGLMMGALYSRNKFLSPAFGPLIYNVAIILGGLITAHLYAADIRYLSEQPIRDALHVYFDPKSTPAQIAELSRTVDIGHLLKIGTRAVSGYSWGALIGAFVGNFCLQVISMRRIGMKFVPSFNVSHPGVKKVFALMLPVILGLSLPMVDTIINRCFGNLLAEGTVTALDNANRLMLVPYGVFGQAFATAVFPTLSALATQKLWNEYRSQLSQSLRGIVFLTLPASVLIMVLAIPIIRFVFQHGKLFTHKDTLITAVPLILYCAGVMVWSMQAIIARAYYSLQDTVTVVVSGTIATAVFVLMNYGFIHSPWARAWYAPGGLALTTTIAVVIHTFILISILRRRLGGIDGRRLLSSISKMLLASGVMAAVTGAGCFYLENSHRFQSIVHRGTIGWVTTGGEIIALSGIGLLFYCGLAKLLKLPELDYATSMFRNRFRRKSA